ncbi:CopL family metal-binding regulatory protein [Lysobacter tyrosinilyticus]
MSIGSLLLRALLSLCLVLNGVAGAAASVHMQLPMQAPVQMHQMHEVAPASAVASDDNMPCHGHHMASTAKLEVTTAPAPAPTESKSKHTPDCCKSGTCRCACVHIAQVGVPTLHLPPAALDHDRSVRPLALGHATPALPHPIRPPIG